MPLSHRFRWLSTGAAAWTVVAVLALGMVPGATAHENANHGTIKVHDEESVDPPTQNQPHVCSPFWIEGFDMSDENGTLVFTSIPPTSNPPVEVLVVNWTADSGSEEDGYHFNQGPINLPDGHYKVEAFVNDPEPHSREHKTKSKVFWVQCEGEPPCDGPADVTALANDNETISIDWSAVVGADGYNIYRAVGAGSFALLDTVDGSTLEYLDEDVTAGITYRYRVTAIVNDDEETDHCDEAEATAIPDLPGVFAMGMAAVGGLGAYALVRRRKA
jgi:hypothetical protein